MQTIAIGAIAYTNWIPKSIIPDNGPHCDSYIIKPSINTAVLETADDNACPTVVWGSCSIAYASAGFSGFILNNCPISIAGVTTMATPESKHCNVVNPH